MTKGIMYYLFLPDNEKQLVDYYNRNHGSLKHRTHLRYLYLIHHLLHYRSFANDLYIRQGIAINRNKLAESLAVRRKLASKIIRDLVKWQMIEKVRGFKQGSYSRAYRLNESLEALPVTILPVASTEAPFIRKLIEKEGQTLEGSPLLQNQLSILQNCLTINKAGEDYLRNKYPSQMIDVLLANHRNKGTLSKEELTAALLQIGFEPVDAGLLNILAGRLYAKRPDEDSRLYTNVANLKREQRDFLHFNDKPLLLTDISNSQVLFSVPVLRQFIKTATGLPETPVWMEMERYQESAEEGIFFECLLERMPQGKMGQWSRAEVKEAFWGEVFFSNIYAKGPVKQAFKKMYPHLAKIINRIKKGNHNQFALRLQRMEASVIIDTVLTDLISQGKQALTIHDSVVVTNHEDRTYAERLIRKTMVERYNMVPKFKH